MVLLFYIAVGFVGVLLYREPVDRLVSIVGPFAASDHR